jgi:hypothetical protein
MRILLDTKDLIDLLERNRPIAVSEFDRLLRAGSHELVLSYVNVTEIVAPLRMGAEFVEIRPILIALESLPACYIRDSMIPGDELREAVSAFDARREPCTINPYVRRWDGTITPLGESAMRQFLNVRLWEIVWILLKQGAIPDFSKEADQLRSQFQVERALPANQRQTSREIFVGAVERHLRTYQIKPPKNGMRPFAEWLYDNPRWCPANRVTFDMYHTLLRNRTDLPKNSDILDINHLKSLPYVDLLTLDRRMESYFIQVLNGLAGVGQEFQFREKVQKNLDEVLMALASSR